MAPCSLIFHQLKLTTVTLQDSQRNVNYGGEDFSREYRWTHCSPTIITVPINAAFSTCFLVSAPWTAGRGVRNTASSQGGSREAKAARAAATATASYPPLFIFSAGVPLFFPAQGLQSITSKETKKKKSISFSFFYYHDISR